VVQFWEGGKLLGASSLAAGDGPSTSAVATFVTSTLSPGTHAIRSVYVGNFNFDGQTASTSQDVGTAETVTGISATPNPATYGQDVTLTATVTGDPNAPTAPSGTVTFKDGGTVLGTAPLATVAGTQQATLTVSGLHGGDHALTATYSGDTGFAGSTSQPYTEHVNRAASTVHALGVITHVGSNGGRFRATLTDGDGHGIAGQSLVFTTTQLGGGVHAVCTGVTDGDGYAECDNTNLVPGVLVDSGFDVTFNGNGDYQGSQDHGTYFAGE
jgi:hypothetical protein